MSYNDYDHDYIAELLASQNDTNQAIQLSYRSAGRYGVEQIVLIGVSEFFGWVAKKSGAKPAQVQTVKTVAKTLLP